MSNLKGEGVAGRVVSLPSGRYELQSDAYKECAAESGVGALAIEMGGRSAGIVMSASPADGHYGDLRASAPLAKLRTSSSHRRHVV